MIPDIELVVKNYRCFDDSSPLRFTVGNGAVAFVGPNNSGKSAVLRFIYETRQIWNNFAGKPVDFIGDLFTLSRGGSKEIGFHGVLDQTEIFTNSNERPLTIDFKISNSPTLSTQHNYMMAGSISIDRNRQLRLTNLIDRNGSSISPRGTGNPQVLNHFRQLDFEFSDPVFRSLSNSCYIGAFRNAINIGTGAYFDLFVGTTFIDEWRNWKVGVNKAQNKAMGKVEEDIRILFGFERLQINPSSDSKSMAVIVDDQHFRLDELGAGLAQFIVVLGNLAVKKPSLVLIDEPELNLHPAFQTRFLSTIQSYARDSVLFSSHSIGLARSSAERIYSVTKSGRSSSVKSWGTNRGYLELAGELSFSAWPEMGAGKILLCEGTSEVKSLQHFLRLLKKDKDVLVIPLGGASLINGKTAAELAELKRLNAPIAVLIDSEKVSADAALSADRVEFVETCKKLEFSVHVLALRAFENYLSDSAIKATKGPKYSSLTPYQDVKTANPAWAKSENWLIAGQMGLTDVENTDLGEFLKSL